MLQILEDYNITSESFSEKVIGQSYDGAATMSGVLNGVQAQITEHFPAVYYNHCMAHRMALCAKTSANQFMMVSKFSRHTDKLITFFRISMKRTRNIGHQLPNQETRDGFHMNQPSQLLIPPSRPSEVHFLPSL